MAHKQLSTDPRIETTLVCDGVRKEISGQETIVGVYADKLVTGSLPINFHPTLYMRIRFNGEGSYHTQFKVTQNNNQLIPAFSVVIVAQDGAMLTTVVLGPIPLTIQSEGGIKFSVKIESGEWLEIYSLLFEKGDPAPMTVLTGQVSTA